MKKHVARYLRRAANRLDPQLTFQSTWQPWTIQTSGSPNLCQYELASAVKGTYGNWRMF